MIYIATALYCEAKPFIEQSSLKRDTNAHKFQVFSNEALCLIITGQGKVNAAIAATYLFSLYPPDSSSLFINTGIAGCINKEISNGSVFRINQIKDEDTARFYYPDCIYTTSVKEGRLYTVSSPIDFSSLTKYSSLVNNNTSDAPLTLKSSAFIPTFVDMEASGIYQAAHCFLQPHQLFFYKVVSDHCDFVKEESAHPFSKDQITNWMTQCQDTIHEEILLCKSKLEASATLFFEPEEEELFERISNTLDLSVTMQHSLRQLFRYSILKNKDILQTIKNDLDSPKYQVHLNRKEGKILFEQLRKQFI